MTSSRRLEELRAEARYYRERRDLYRAKAYGPRATSPFRLRELERVCVYAEARLRRAQQEQEAERRPTGGRPLHEAMKADIVVEVPACIFEVGDNVVYPQHGAGIVVKREARDLLGENRDYLTIQILHNSMTVMVPCENAHTAGLRRVIDREQVKKVIGVLTDQVSEMPKSWTVRFKHNREKIKTGDVYELAEVVRNLAIRESEKGLSAGEKQMYARAKKILASEFMYALDKDEDGAASYLDELLDERFGPGQAEKAPK